MTKRIMLLFLFMLTFSNVFAWIGTGESESVFLTSMPPNAPAPLLPENYATMVPDSVVCKWQRTLHAANYQIEVSKLPDFSTLAYNQTGIVDSTFTLTGLEYDTPYYWHLSATNVAGISPWSPTWQFTTMVGAPAAPQLYQPANHLEDLATTAELRWYTVSGAENYHLQVTDDSSFSKLIIDENNLTNNWYTAALEPSKTYYWRVCADNAGGSSPQSEVWQFSTIMAPPAAPSLASPADGSTGLSGNLTLSWEQVSDADSYHLQISLTADFNTLVTEITAIEETQYLTTLEGNKIYHWRVSGLNDGGEGPFSDGWTFATASTGIADADKILPTTFALQPAFPNPFNSTVSIAYDVPENEYIELKIYNSSGQTIQTLFEGIKPQGSHIAKWNGLDQNGQQAASGMYLCRLKAKNQIFIQKMIMIQ